MTDLQISDCSEELALIDRYRTYHDITPRFIAWGVKAIAEEAPNSRLTQDWNRLTESQRWNRIRANLSAPAIRALAARIAKEYKSPPPDYRPAPLITLVSPSQLSILDGGK